MYGTYSIFYVADLALIQITRRTPLFLTYAVVRLRPLPNEAELRRPPRLSLVGLTVPSAKAACKLPK